MIDEETNIDGISEEEERIAYLAKLQSFAESTLKTRSEAIEFRASCGVEKRWRLSEKLYDYASEETQPSMMDYVSGDASIKSKGPKRSRVTMNIIRGRCETAEGRFADTMLPVDDKNWGLKVTPNPEMDNMQDEQRPAMQGGMPVTDESGQQVPMAVVVQDLRARAEKAMSGMEREIADQLTECDYNGECRDLVHKSVKLGTGIMKGPSVVKSSKRKWSRVEEIDDETAEIVVAHVLKTSDDNQPASKSVDPWNVYPSPDCGEDIRRASYVWEKDSIRPREVRSLIGLPDYNEEQLLMVLEEAPLRTTAASNRRGSAYKTQSDHVAKSGLYEIWEYHGDVSTEDMALLGCSCQGSKTVSACVVFINDRPVKAKLNTLDTGDLPYCFFPWTKVSDEPWGIGIPYILMWVQRVIDAAWRATMDNAGDSAGSQVALMGLEPADGKWELTGKKIWRPDGDTDIDDVRKAFAQFQLTNNQEPLQRIIEMALRFADLETSTPSIFQGETQEVPDTLGATNIMVDSSNVSLRSRIKRYDDCVTKPHLRMYYDWNMQYNKNQEIKGDYDVDPRGVSVLYERDQQAQQLLQVFKLKADPDINRKTDWDKAIEQYYSSRRLNILKDEAKVQEAQKAAQHQPKGPGNPAMEVAQVRVQGELEKAKLVQQSDMSELQFKAQQAELDRQHKKVMKEMDLKMKMMEFAERRNMEVDKLKTQLALGSAGMNLQRELSHKKVSVPQVVSPPTEPAGQAPSGEAFQR